MIIKQIVLLLFVPLLFYIGVGCAELPELNRIADTSPARVVKQEYLDIKGGLGWHIRYEIKIYIEPTTATKPEHFYKVSLYKYNAPIGLQEKRIHWTEEELSSRTLKEVSFVMSDIDIEAYYNKNLPANFDKLDSVYSATISTDKNDH